MVTKLLWSELRGGGGQCGQRPVRDDVVTLLEKQVEDITASCARTLRAAAMLWREMKVRFLDCETSVQHSKHSSFETTCNEQDVDYDGWPPTLTSQSLERFGPSFTSAKKSKKPGKSAWEAMDTCASALDEAVELVAYHICRSKGAGGVRPFDETSASQLRAASQVLYQHKAQEPGLSLVTTSLRKELQQEPLTLQEESALYQAERIWIALAKVLSSYQVFKEMLGPPGPLRLEERLGCERNTAEINAAAILKAATQMMQGRQEDAPQGAIKEQGATRFVLRATWIYKGSAWRMILSLRAIVKGKKKRVVYWRNPKQNSFILKREYLVAPVKDAHHAIEDGTLEAEGYQG
ncbi:hypothetical protein AK812_SmicGene1527 [Symbiodinium microadriaticum]|uniref:Uncharacterized protein n=1 Tax=Symbiodinium microadriaticum TaxID=2951 RepID=A0A1Q9F433_SYMMI|nr:hypothetical protein AK812_SmicGene1527 [Symbiodinium microadriaticum]